MDTDSALLLSDRIRAAIRARRQALHTVALLLVELVDGRHHQALGYATLGEYALKVLDLPARKVRDLLRIGRALPRLPRLAAAMEEGAVDWSKLREVIRVATPETEAAWVARCAVRASRELEKEIAHSRRGDLPPDELPPERAPERRRVSFELESVDEGVIFDAIAVFRARTGVSAAELEDGAILAAIARFAIEHTEVVMTPIASSIGGEETVTEVANPPGGVVSTGERYQVVLDMCPCCATTTSRDSEVSDTIVQEAACDAERIDMRPGPGQGHATRAIPPATRRKVLHRAGGQCEVPGCSNHLWVDVHHLVAWALGGGHDLWNLAVLCTSHHRASHVGSLAIERLLSGAIQVTHADGRRLVGRVPVTHVGRPPVVYAARPTA